MRIATWSTNSASYMSGILFGDSLVFFRKSVNFSLKSAQNSQRWHHLSWKLNKPLLSTFESFRQCFAKCRSTDALLWNFPLPCFSWSIKVNKKLQNFARCQRSVNRWNQIQWKSNSSFQIQRTKKQNIPDAPRRPLMATTISQFTMNTSFHGWWTWVVFVPDLGASRIFVLVFVTV